jgi:hypothetical protein
MPTSARAIWPALITALLVGCAANATTSESAIPSSTSLSTASLVPAPSATGAPSRSPGSIGWAQTGSFGRDGGWDRVTGIVQGASGLLAIGNRIEPAFDAGYMTTGDYLWASSDGRAWEELPLPATLDGSSLVAVSTTPTGAFILYANRYAPSGLSSEPIVLTSADGRGDWTEAGSGLPADLYIRKVVRGPVGYLLLVPQSGGHDPALWFSETGLDWELTHAFSQVDHWMQVSDIGAGSEGFAAVAIQIEQDETTWNRVTIASGDGHAWFENPQPFGPQDPGYRPDAFLIPMGPDWLAALPAKDDSARFWSSANGLEWHAAGHIDDIPTTLSWSPVLIHAGDRLLFSHDGNDLPVGYGGSPVWASIDGDTWRAEPIDQAISLRAAVSGSGWTVFGGSLLVGTSNARAAFWYLPSD